MNNIIISLPKEDYTGGEVVEGEVIVTLEQPLPVRGIRLSYAGYEKSLWSEGSGKHRRTYSERKDHFAEEITLFGRPRLELGDLMADSLRGLFSKEHYETHPAGTHRYPFACTLPLDLPGDYQSAESRSEIKYAIKATVDLPLKFDLSAEQSFTVYERRNLDCLVPVSARERKAFLFDSDAFLEAEVQLAKDHFFLGETLLCRLDVQNHSQKKIDAVQLALEQTEHLTAGNEHKTEVEYFGVATYPNCTLLPNQQTHWELEFPIPTELYPSILRSTLVRVEYQLQARIEIPWAIDLKIHVPIVLCEVAGSPGGKS